MPGLPAVAPGQRSSIYARVSRRMRATSTYDLFPLLSYLTRESNSAEMLVWRGFSRPVGG